MSAAVPFLPMSPALEGIPGPAFGRVLDVQLHVAWISEGSLNTNFFGGSNNAHVTCHMDTSEFRCTRGDETILANGYSFNF